MLGWWDKYRGIPYKQDGCTFAGCGCWGLVVLVYQNELGITLPDYSGVASSADKVAYEEAAGLIPSYWREIRKPKEFDVITFKVGRLFHVGIVTQPRHIRFLHVCHGISVSMEFGDSIAWKRRITGISRHIDAPTTD